jgi:RNA polymerase sigma factor (sigma-70 family)
MTHVAGIHCISVKPPRRSARTTHVATLTDESLLAGMSVGDADAAATFVRRYQARVYGLALTVVGIPALAEEVAQESFVKAWRHAAAYDARRGRVDTWLLTITRNTAIDTIRYRRETPMDPDVLTAVLVADDDMTTRPTDSVASNEQVRSALRQLPSEQSRPVVLMTFYGLTAKDIAERDGIPIGTVKTRVRRGLSALRDRLGARDD